MMVVFVLGLSGGADRDGGVVLVFNGGADHDGGVCAGVEWWG